MLDTIVFLILLALGMWVAWKIIKSILKVIAVAVFVMLFCAIAGGYLFDKGANEFVQDFPGDDTLLLLQDDEVFTAVYIRGDDITVLNPTEIEGYNKTVTFTTEFFNEGLPKTFELEEYVPGTFDKDGMLALLTSDSEEEYKAYVFLSAVGHTLESKGTIFLYNQYKKGNYKIEPAPLSFTLASKVPSFLVVPVLFFLSF